MSNYSNFCQTIHQYLNKYDCTLNFESDTKEVSMNSDAKKYLCNKALSVIDMDLIAKKAYRLIRKPESKTENDSINTADAFLINNENQFYLIEFKDAVFSSATKVSVLKKAYCNVYAILDILYEMKETEFVYQQFDYLNPMKFIRENVNYICVFSSEKNPEYVIKEKNHRLKKEAYTPNFMDRLQGYIFCRAYAMSELTFQNEFIKAFRF